MQDYPADFVELIRKKFGDESDDFLTAIQHAAQSSIRINPTKWKAEFQLGPWSEVPWYSKGYTYKDRPSYIIDPAFHAGAYYVQESSSMFIGHVLQSIKSKLPTGAIVLDLCAAPGGKSTLLLDEIGNDAILVANETIKARSLVLKENIMKWGRNNCVVTNMDPKEIGERNTRFDLILVDAPCSGEGLFRKDPQASTEWSLDNVALCAARQNRIVDDILPVLADGGYLIYSTCTYNDEENIKNVLNWQKKFDLESVKIDVPGHWGVTISSLEDAEGYHFYPHKVSGEGFFCAVLQKSGTNDVSNIQHSKSQLQQPDKQQNEAINQFVKRESLRLIHKNGDVYHYNEALGHKIHDFLAEYRLIYSGIKCGNLNKTLFIPDHALALSEIIQSNIPKHQLEIEEARAYLRRNLQSINNPTKSWMLIQYQDLNLGWIKNLGNRINNYFPQELRIRNA
ncbi:MAG: hypothetical protein KDC49_18595 [Saprospiraceae bacterium]|nr:hypothetical protein [Saprospiraceae bacterium]